MEQAGKEGKAMMWFVEMRNRQESFPRAGIKRVSIEESSLLLNDSDPAPTPLSSSSEPSPL